MKRSVEPKLVREARRKVAFLRLLTFVLLLTFFATLALSIWPIAYASRVVQIEYVTTALPLSVFSMFATPVLALAITEVLRDLKEARRLLRLYTFSITARLLMED